LISGGGFDGAPAPVPKPVPIPMPIPIPVPAPVPWPAPNVVGKITSAPLPAQSGSTYGVGYYGFPFVNNRGCKHVCGASDGLRIYFQGGDTIASATDGTWSCDMSGSDWRLEVGRPPAVVAPHAYQDGFGFEFVGAKALLWPGDIFPYEPWSNPPTAAELLANPVLNYAGGIFWLDPATRTYTQDKRLFGAWLSGTGSPFGGVLDEINMHIVELMDSGANICRRWDLATMTRLPNIAFNVPAPASNVKATSAYFTQSKHAKIGRYVYVIGYSTDGVVKIPRFWRWHLDLHTFVELAPPPIDAALITQPLEMRLAVSHSKVVWPLMNGPDGELHGIWIYDPAKNQWAVDTQVPIYGNFIANSIVNLPDGRVGMSGGNFGRQQTHFWFYEAA
jgi:hypothetical protein